MFHFALGEERFLEGLKCSAESVDQANSAQLHSILAELSDLTFFRLVHVDSDGVCPLDNSEGPTCGTVEPPPLSFVAPSPAGTLGGGSLCSVETEQEFASSVITQISVSERFAQREFPRDNECVVEGTFSIRPDYWLDICEGSSVGEFVNLRLNPERNTGYNGSHVWSEMHTVVNRLESVEGQILARIVSGYHMSVTTQVMANYYPPDWKSNDEKLGKVIVENPNWVRDMQFAFVVMARSLFKIKNFLYDYSFSTGNATEDTLTRSLVRHLLDSSVLSSCESVVMSGFDESVLFSSQQASAATEFKKSFRQLSKLVNCVGCKRCKLHASVSLHGIGAGLKILLSPSSLVTASLSRDDIVALVNTVHKLSDSLALVARFSASSSATGSDLIEEALTAVRDRAASLTRIEKDSLIHAILTRNEQVMLLAKTFLGSNHVSFVRHALISLGLGAADTLVIGGGLAGLVTAISVAERGGSVVVLEKQATLGGNSAKASSGINSIRTNQTDDFDEFLKDTISSQNGHGSEELARVLINRANVSVSWLEGVTGVSLSSLGQLGGHQSARTWKPEHGVVGAELMAALIGVIKKRFSGLIRVITNAKVTDLISNGDDRIEGLKYQDMRSGSGELISLAGRSVVIASGGFGFGSSLLKAYRPDLVGFPTTLGSQTTGDGIALAASVGADLVDMEYVQLHPTGFVDPSDRKNPVKVLAAEVLRGIGGILLNRKGKRFVNELGTRKAVVEAMLGQDSDEYFWLVISENSAEKASDHITLYSNRGLLKRIDSLTALSELIGTDAIAGVLERYQDQSRLDDFGRVAKGGLPFEGAFFVGQVTPVVHYTMGGIRIDSGGRVLRRDGSVVEGLFAVGEVAGGVHGENRLGGNSLLECTVFGRIIGLESIHLSEELSAIPTFDDSFNSRHKKKKPAPVKMNMATVEEHATVDDCWTVIDNKVYDLSRYSEQHPGGTAAIKDSCGKDSTRRFLVAHSLGLLSDAGFDPIGILHED